MVINRFHFGNASVSLSEKPTITMVCVPAATALLALWRKYTYHASMHPGIHLGMLFGRLEIFTLLVVLTPALWRR